MTLQKLASFLIFEKYYSKITDHRHRLFLVWQGRIGSQHRNSLFFFRQKVHASMKHVLGFFFAWVLCLVGCVSGTFSDTFALPPTEWTDDLEGAGVPSSGLDSVLCSVSTLVRAIVLVFLVQFVAIFW